MKFNSHPPNSVFIKAVTITASRQAWPAQLGSAQLCGYILYKEGGGRRALARESAARRTRDCEKEGEGGHSVNKAAKDCGSQQQGDRGA